MQIFIAICRFLLAAIFMFSGFVKGVDPLGTAYKIEDYLLVYNMDWALQLSLILSFALIAFEFSLGLMLAFNLLPKFTKWSLVLLMTIFTLVTFFDAIYNPVPDCGCFGDFLILTNWQTFYKNIFIDLLIIALFFNRIKPYNRIIHLSWSLAIFFAFLSFSYYNLKHLPIIDFRFWKVGNQVYEAEPKSIEFYLTYKNKISGESQEFLSPHFPYNDSTWLAQWEFVKLREVNPNLNSRSISFFEIEGTNVTSQVLGFQGKYLLIIAHNLTEIENKKVEKIKQLIRLADQEMLPVFLITASVGEVLTDFISESLIDIPIYLADDIDLKTIIRSNPGLVLLDNGKVIKKWAFADFPELISQIYD